MIKVEHLSLQLQGQTILSDINVEIPQGDYLTILGPNGSGKSTLLKCLNGILTPSSGQIQLNDQSLRHYSTKQLAQHLCYVPQASGQQLPFSVEEFVKMARYPYHTAMSAWEQTDREAVEQALEITETTAFRHRQMTTLSGGEAQRVMIAAALCQHAPIMLLDEPNSYLDPHHQAEVHQLITRLNREHQITMIEVTHDINHASQHAKHILALQQGQVLWSGHAGDFLSVERLQALYHQSFILMQHPKTGAPIALAEQ